MTEHPEWLQRTELLLGSEKLEKLRQSHVFVVGLGGVGAYAAEMLCRAGVGKMTIADGDKIHCTNRNRQLIALSSAEGRSKAETMAQRLLDINPELELTVIEDYIKNELVVNILKETPDGKPFDYVVDAIDTLSPKVFLIYLSVTNGLKIVSSMGSGGRYDPTQVKIADISKSHHCNLASALRKRLHRMGVYKGVQVVYSAEEVHPDSVVTTNGEDNKRSIVGTISYMPPVFGCFLASVVIRDLIC